MDIARADAKTKKINNSTIVVIINNIQKVTKSLKCNNTNEKQNTNNENPKLR